MLILSMGRIKTKIIKRLTVELLEKHSDEFSDDYAKNKEVLENFVELHSTKMKNVIAGYVTKLKKSNKEE